MRSQPKWYRFLWPELLVLPIALILAGGAYGIWIVGANSLAGFPHQRFDDAMVQGTLQAELVLVLPIWLFLRGADIGARMLRRLFRPGLPASSPGGLRTTS